MYCTGIRNKTLCSITFAEVLNSSDLPGGVVNILTGKPSELASWFVDHMDVNATIYCENDSSVQKMIREKSALNLKRVFFYDTMNWSVRGRCNRLILLWIRRRSKLPGTRSRIFQVPVANYYSQLNCSLIIKLIVGILVKIFALWRHEIGFSCLFLPAWRHGYQARIRRSPR